MYAMAWLTDDERRENWQRDEEARRQGYRDSYDRERQRRDSALRNRLEEVRRRVSSSDIQTILEAKREGLL